MGQKSQQDALFFRFLTKKSLAHVIFFKFFMKNPLLSSPYMVKKTSNLSKLHYFGPEKTIGCPSFLIFHGKIIALISTAHIFWKNCPFSKNHLFLCPYYVKKHPFSRKQIALISFLSNFLLKTPCVHTYIWSKKRQFCQNYTLWPRKWIGCPFFRIFHDKNLL